MEDVEDIAANTKTDTFNGMVRVEDGRRNQGQETPLGFGSKVRSHDCLVMYIINTFKQQ